MSTTIDFGKQPSFDDLTRGEGRGFAAKLLNPHPNYAAIEVQENRVNLVNNLATHVQNIISTFNDENLYNRSVREITIGKKFAKLYKYLLCLRVTVRKMTLRM
jgi:hypothetical protein